MSAVLEAREPSVKYLSALQPPLVRHFELMATGPGGVARLRELILTLAVQGKLVPQDPTEAPATKLLKDIQAEKNRLIAAKALKREKDEPEVTKDALPFALPASWTWAALGAVIDIVRGITFPATHKTKEAAPGRIACLRTSNVQQTIEWDDLLFVERSFMGREDQLIQHHDIVMSMANSRELVGKVALIDHIPHPEATFGGFLGVLRPRMINPRYAMAVLRTPYAREMLIDSSSQTTNIANVSLAKLRPLPFPLPPAAEQSRIVARVEELMRLCDALEAKGQLEAAQHAQLVQTLLDALTASTSPDELADNWQRVATHFDLLLDRPEAIDALEQTILQLAVRGLLVPQDPKDEPASELLKKIRAEKDRLIAESKIKRDNPLAPVDDEEVPFKLPPGWTWARFPELGEFGRGKSKHRPRNDPALFQPPIYPVVQTGEVARAKGVIREFHSKYSEIGLAQSKLWPAGTLCITIAANIADAAVLGFDACFPDSVVGFVPAQSIGLADYFLAFMETAKAHLTEFAPATAQKNINLEILGALLVPVPPLAEMRRIVARVESLRRLCADLRQRLAARQATQAHLAEALIAEVA
jgi:type I restriction enzyme S subunit